MEPIPRFFHIGDLRDIARQVHHGGDTNAVKQTFELNASAFIRAKLAYRAGYKATASEALVRE